MKSDREKVVTTLLEYKNIHNLSWMKVYKEVLKDLELENKIKDNSFLSEVVTEITKRGYDIVDEPFNLEKYK